MPRTTDFKCYVDASFASDEDTRCSTTGYVFKISGGPLSWQSRMQTPVALSSMESDYMAASAAAQEAIWLNRLLEELLSQFTKTIRQQYFSQTTLEIIEDQSTLIRVSTSYVKQ